MIHYGLKLEALHPLRSVQRNEVTMQKKYYRCLECNDWRGSQRIPESRLLHQPFVVGKSRRIVLKCPYCRGKVKLI